VSGQLHAPSSLSPRKGPPSHTLWIGGRLDLRAGLEAMEKRRNLPLLGTEPSHLARRLSLYLLSYPGSLYMKSIRKKYNSILYKKPSALLQPEPEHDGYMIQWWLYEEYCLVGCNTVRYGRILRCLGESTVCFMTVACLA
jgi:hypothetical protein